MEALTGASDGAVATAAHAALAAARSISEPELAPTAAAAAAQAAVLDAGDCAMMQALRFVQSRCADHVRAVIDASTVVAALDSVETR